MKRGDLVRIKRRRDNFVILGGCALNPEGVWEEDVSVSTRFVESGTLGIFESVMTFDNKKVFVIWVPSQESFGWLWNDELESVDETR